MTTLRIALAQLNPTVGDIDGNAAKIVAWALRARDELKADLVVFPELALTGYPPEDLLLRPAFLDRTLAGLEEIKRQVRGIDVILGYPRCATGGLYNAASLLRDGQIVATYHKAHLPNYGVFDERRYFVPGGETCVVEVKGVPVGLTVCEDIWLPGPVEEAAAAGAQLVVNINASPFHLGKGDEREGVLKQRIEAARVPVVYVNQVGGQDELVFDGHSFVMDAVGQVSQRAPGFEEGLYPAEFHGEGEAVWPVPQTALPMTGDEESVYRALVLGVRDYIGKNGFPGVVLGLSGGIDSALVLAIAVDAIGAARCEAISMPSRYTADMSVEDARLQAEIMGVPFCVIPIEPTFNAFIDSLKEEFAGLPPDVTEENIQARCRGVLLMAVSNKKRKMVLTTGNKSETAVGYSTLYGDMAGGFDVLKDVPKTLVYRLAEYRNRIAPVIPRRVIERAPSAELAAGQRDSDSLPPYEVLDGILERYVEQDQSVDEIVAAGFERATVERVARLVDRNEYKRRQAPPGPRITRRAFGRDRRYPITNGFKG
ncbi:MAG: NAD+ synthase [Gammaproteobacteria bacterium]|nr:NAD+ synthase [Gammaproteobacteria bacterium]